jgi:hypothetical protein
LYYEAGDTSDNFAETRVKFIEQNVVDYLSAFGN